MSVKKTSKGYQVDWRDAGGKRHRKTFRTKSAAEAHERQMIDQKEQGILPTHGSGTLADFLPEWEKTVYPGLRENTRQGYSGAVRKHIKPRFGDVKLRQIDQRMVQDWVNDMTAAETETGKRKFSARTIEFQFAVLSTIMKLAAEYGMCRPVRKSGRGRGGVRLPKNVPTPRVPPTIAQIEQLASVIDPRYSAMVRLAGYCGLRQSECFGLHPDAVDFTRHKIHVRRTVEHATGSLVDLTKNGKPRTVTMTAPVAESLRRHMAEWPNPEFVFHNNGKHLESGHFHRDVWKDARELVGLPELWFHDLRHSAPSIMAAGGWGVKKVQHELGHHSASFTLDRYSHLWAEEEDSARTTLNDALEQAILSAKSAPGETRTPTSLRTADFEPAASTDSATGADDEPTREETQ